MSDIQDQVSNDSEVNYLEMEDSAMPDFPPEASSQEIPEEEEYTEEQVEEDSSPSEDYADDDNENTEQTDEDSYDEQPDAESPVGNAEYEPDDSSESDVNYEAEYARITAPFRANGRNIQVGTVDNALRLMQMGANYAKNMEGLKPHRKLVKMLGNQDLLDEGKLNMLIDVAKGDKAALRQIIKDNELDVNDLYDQYDEDDKTEYVPTDHSVSEQEVEMQSVLDELRPTPAYRETLNVVTREWGQDSQALINESPEILRTLNQHIESGVYNQIKDRMEDMKMYGQYPKGVPEVEVYGRLFGEMAPQGQQPQNQQPPSAEPSRKAQNEESRKAKRNAAGSTRKRNQSASPVIKDIIDMSDEEFLSQTNLDLFRVV